LVAAAEGGTLFLDEIGDLDPPIQVKLLRFLESQEIRPVGSDRTRKVDVRIVSATHRDLKRRVRDGVFRHDLYYRLGGTTILIPPLRERPGDLADLRDHFERLAVLRHGLKPARWSNEAIDALGRYRWPGNVRELRHVIDVALVRAAGGPVGLEHLQISSDVDPTANTWEAAQFEFRSRFLEAALHRHGGNRSATARELGISRQALLYHLRNLGLTHILKN
jgi:sigma-54-dependent transcriptional regulator